MLKKRFIILFIWIFLTLVASQRDEKVCTSVTIRSEADLQQLQDCTIVAGHVRLVLGQFTNETLLALKPLDIEEITDYLLVYRFNGLDSLERLFPKLLVIRGAQLLYTQYALVIDENRNLENIGLISLLRVIRGSVRIESNPSLCYANTINWLSILGYEDRKYHYILKNNKPSNYCPLCHGINPSDDNRHKHCWSHGKLQKQPLEEFSDKCPTDCPSKKCNKKGKCCSGNCLTSCTDDKCRYCSNLISGTKCVDNCLPPLSMLFNRQCVPDCHRFGLVRLGGECVDKCPKLYREVKQNDVVTSCSLNCTGNFTIRTSKELKGFGDCTILHGSLTLELTNINKTDINDVYNELGYLREITGYLKVIKSPQLVSFSFLRNLNTIGGSDLIDDLYSLYVVDNHNLEYIWNDNQKVSILRGRISFHLNPHLCYKKIVDIVPQLKESDISVMDVSPNSNGERGICESRNNHLNATVEVVNAHEARILLGFLTPNELTPLLGYTYYYKEAPQRNISQLDGRHACGRDDWFSESVLSKQRRYVLKHLKPSTQYAFFVKTFVIVNYHYDFDAMSDIQYFRTAPAKPGPVQKIFYKSVTDTEIEVHWWPPLLTNGNIEKYLLRYEPAEANNTVKTTCTGQQCYADACVCPKLDPQTARPPPVDTDYYRREHMVFETALLNFIYVPSPHKGTSNARNKSGFSEKDMEEMKKRFDRYQEQIIIEANREQDYHPGDFDIVPVLPVCTVTNPSVVYKKENNCTDSEEYESDFELTGDYHSFSLRDLEPQITYRISLRACVEGLQNGCGPETILYAHTVSKSLEQFLEGLKLTADTVKRIV